MTINTNNAEKKGRVVIFKNNRPKLLVIDLDTEPQIEMTEDEKLEFVAARILREPALKVFAINGIVER